MQQQTQALRPTGLPSCDAQLLHFCPVPGLPSSTIICPLGARPGMASNSSFSKPAAKAIGRPGGDALRRCVDHECKRRYQVGLTPGSGGPNVLASMRKSRKRRRVIWGAPAASSAAPMQPMQSKRTKEWEEQWMTSIGLKRSSMVISRLYHCGPTRAENLTEKWRPVNEKKINSQLDAMAKADNTCNGRERSHLKPKASLYAGIEG